MRAVIVAILLSWAAAYAQERCAACHAARDPAIVAACGESVHAKAVLGCASCHGGDRAAEAAAAAHAAAAGFKGPLTNRAARIASCGECHAAPLRAFREGPHGPVLPPDDGRTYPDCASCHGSHEVGEADAALVLDRCEPCHAERPEGAGAMFLALARASLSQTHLEAAGTTDARLLRDLAERRVAAVHRADTASLEEVAGEAEAIYRELPAAGGPPGGDEDSPLGFLVDLGVRIWFVTVIVPLAGSIAALALVLFLIRRARRRRRAPRSES